QRGARGRERDEAGEEPDSSHENSLPYARGRPKTVPKFALRTASLVREPELVIADAKSIAFVDGFALNALSVVLDAVGRAHVHDVILAVEKLDHRVLAGHVGIFDRQVARLLAATDDEAVLVDPEHLTLVLDRKPPAGAASRRRWGGPR